MLSWGVHSWGHRSQGQIKAFEWGEVAGREDQRMQSRDGEGCSWGWVRPHYSGACPPAHWSSFECISVPGLRHNPTFTLCPHLSPLTLHTVT